MFKASGILVIVMLQAALVLEEWRHQSYMVALKVKVPPIRSLAPLHTLIDLVIMLDIRQSMIGEKLLMLKHIMWLLWPS